MDVREKLVEFILSTDLGLSYSRESDALNIADNLIAHGVTVQSEIDAKTFQLMREFERLKEEKESLANAVNVLEEINSDLCKQIKCVTVQEWISVKDRLPEPFVSVLVQMPGEEPFPTVREGFISNDGIWQSAMYRREPGEVTHWQPMPQPPKGE